MANPFELLRDPEAFTMKLSESELREQDALTFLYSLRNAIDTATDIYTEVVRLRLEVEKLKAENNRLLDTGLKQAQTSARNVLLAGLAISGEEGRELAKTMIDKEPAE